MATQAEFVRACKTATERLFEQRRATKKAVRFAFTPEGLWIATGVWHREDGEMENVRHDTISWERLESIGIDQLLSHVDLMCAAPTVPFDRERKADDLTRR